MSEHIYHPPCMPQLLCDGLNRYHDEPCLYLGDQVASYADVRRRTSQLVQVLQASELGRGKKVAVISGNRPEVLANIAAMQLAGCIGLPLHPLGSLADHAYVVEHAAVDALVFDAALFSTRAGELKAHRPGLLLLGFGPNTVGDDYLARADSFAPLPLVAPAIDPLDTASISYTGGTTGQPKGVLSSYRASSWMTMVQMAEWEFPQELRMLIATPLSHAAAAFFVPVLQQGGAFYVMQGFSPEAFFDMVARHRITATMLVPVMLYYLLDSEQSHSADMSSMETIFYGASAMSPTRLQEAIERWGQVFYQFYGQSEAPMVLANMKRAEHDLSKPERLSACGRPSSWIQLALLDDELQQVPPGTAGEICVRAPLVMKGYLDMPEQTAAAMAGDWLHTGDIGRLDEEGFLYIVDRKKDMVVSGGFNVFPREVEDVLSTHDAVAQVAVIGIPDAKWGEAVTALIVLKPDRQASSALSAELTALVKTAKGAVQAPKKIIYVEAIPLTAVGKPDKKALRAQYRNDDACDETAGAPTMNNND